MILAIHDSDNNRIIKLARIEGFKSGGFMISMPYHPENTGLAFKYKTTYGKRQFIVDRSESTEYTANHKIKLSYHQDGFVQFSSQNKGEIISGKDPKTGKPKGLGVFSHPLDNPISTGPSFGIGFWGLEKFKPLTTERTNVVILNTNTAKWIPEFGDKPSGYFIEGWVLESKEHSHGIVKINGDEYGFLSQVLGNPWDGSARLVRRESLRVLRPEGQSFFLGLLLNKVEFKFGSDSGFQILSPTDGKYGLMAFYPPVKTDDIEKLPSLNYIVKRTLIS